MSLPFTAEQFFDVFGAYNALFWPVLAALWVVSLWSVVPLLRGRQLHRALSALLAVHWAWSGLAYHAAFFATINPAAWLFAALFVVQAVAFLWLGVIRGSLRFDWGHAARHYLAAIFVAASLVYPALSVLAGHPWPRVPAFGVPCPTTLFTTGLLLALAPPVPRWLFLIPIGWSVVGGTAALSLGVRPDLMLFAGAVCLAVYAMMPRPSRANLNVRSTARSVRTGGVPNL